MAFCQVGDMASVIPMLANIRIIRRITVADITDCNGACHLVVLAGTTISVPSYSC